MKYIQIYENFSKTVEMYINDIFNKEWMDNFRYENDYDITDEFFIKYKNEYIELLNKNVIGDYITLYRKVHISSIKNLDTNKIGIYWSFDKNPQSYHYHGFDVENIDNIEYILKANFKLSNINWNISLYTWFLFADIKRENEVTVNANTTFNKLSYSTDGIKYKTISGNFNIGKNTVNESVIVKHPITQIGKNFFVQKTFESFAKKRVVFYSVSDPIYPRYKELKSPVVKCVAKGLIFSEGKKALILEFIQEDGAEMESFTFDNMNSPSSDINFSRKNVEKQLSKLFKNFTLLN